MNATDLCFTSAVELAQLIRRRALSPVEITRSVLRRSHTNELACRLWVLDRRDTVHGSVSGQRSSFGAAARSNILNTAVGLKDRKSVV